MISISASERGVRNIAATEVDIVADYGATPGGAGVVGDGGASTGDYTAFKAFNDWAREQSGWIKLYLPPTPGGYYGTAGGYGSDAPVNAPFAGIKKLIVLGYGASIGHIHGAALRNTANGRALIYTVAAGSKTVRLKDIEDASKYTVGAMVLIAGLDMQGFGYPPNPHFFDWRRITDITDDVITLDQPLENDYRDDWPNWFLGHGLELGGIGAATIVSTYGSWDCEHRIYGVHVQGTGQVYPFYRRSYQFDVKQSGSGVIIGASEDHRIINQQHTAGHHEVDKLTTRGLITEYGPADKNIDFQSSSAGFIEIRGGTRRIIGTPRRILIRGGTRDEIRLGPWAYGITEYAEIRDAVVTSQILGSPGLAASLTDGDLTYEGDGLFRYTGSGPVSWFIPGAVGVIGTATPFYRHSPFRILSVTSESGETGGDVLIQTTLTGDELPEVSNIENVSLLRHSAPNLTVVNCTGCRDAINLSLAPPNSPYGIIWRETLTLNGGTQFGFLMGRLVHLKVNVQQAYTGVASALTLRLGGTFGGFLIKGDWTSARNESSPSQINLKVAGERIITPEGVTGVQSGDTGLDFYTGGVWMSASFGVFIGNGSSAVDISGEDASVRPIVTVEMLTDQEIPAA
jgi:hypothetical protein